MEREAYKFSPTLEGLTDRLMTLLSDDEKDFEGQTWSRSFVRAIAGDAMAFVGSLKERDFARVERVELTDPSGFFTVPDGCSKILNIEKFAYVKEIKTLGGGTKTVETVITAVAGDYEELRAAQAYPQGNCSTCTWEEQATLSFAFDQMSDTSFLVSPAPTPQDNVVAYVRCVKNFLDPDDEIPQEARKHFPLILSWAMYQLLSVEADSGSQNSMAMLHRDAFISASSITVRQAEMEYRRAKEQRLGRA